MLSDLTDILANSSPFPFRAENGDRHPGLLLPENPMCSNCHGLACDPKRPPSVWDQCERGLDRIRIPLGEGSIFLYGLLRPSTFQGLSRKRKKAMADWQIDPARLEEWQKRTDSLLHRAEETVDAKVKKTLAGFHNIQATVSALIRGAEEVVHDQEGRNFEEQLEKLPPQLKTLIHSIFLLKARLQLMPLIANPESAAFGDRHRTPVYRVFDRVVRMLRPLGNRRRVSIHLMGTSFNQPDGYNSFEVIPLVLVENGIKYSLPHQAVDVLIEDVPGKPAVNVEVTSFSPFVPPAQVPKLFESGYRAIHSSELASSGSGLGLYLAQTVAAAHGFQIQHRCAENTTQKDGILYCLNTFYFTIV